MRVSRVQIYHLTESALREALRDAVRDALLDVSGEPRVRTAVTSLRRGGIQSLEAPAACTDLSDEEAWERFDSIRFARYAGGSR